MRSTCSRTIWLTPLLIALWPIASQSTEPTSSSEFSVHRDLLGSLPEGVVADTLRISADGKRIAGVVVRGERWIVFVDGVESPDYQAVVQNSIHFSPDSKRVAYGAKCDGKDIVVVDGKTFPAGLACAAGYPIFSANSVHFLYVAAQPEGRMSVVMDGKESASWEAIMQGGPAFGPDGNHFIYVAKDGKASRIVFDGTAGPEYASINAPTFSPDGKHFVYVAATPTACVLVADGREAVVAENFLRDSLGFDSRSLVHILAIDAKAGITRLQIDLAKPLKRGSTPSDRQRTR